jgi:hypothetical protein
MNGIKKSITCIIKGPAIEQASQVGTFISGNVYDNASFVTLTEKNFVPGTYPVRIGENSNLLSTTWNGLSVNSTTTRPGM